MANPIKLGLHQNGDRTEIEIRISHPMYAGDALPQISGHSRPPLFLQHMIIQVNERTLVEGQLSASLAANPRLGFSFSGIRRGDKFTVSFTDNNGKEFKGEVVAQS